MIKPIFIVKLPIFSDLERLSDLQSFLEAKLTDYYPLVTWGSETEIGFQAFYEKDFDEVKFEELKEIVRSSIKDRENEKKISTK